MSISRDTAPHYIWGAACDGWHLVAGADLSVIEERMPPGTSETRHSHAQARQFFYVLGGALTLERDGTRHLLSKGQGIEIAPGTPHQALNEGDADAVFLVISSPRAQGDRQPA
jgi:quercetin dioxygenase-like cupin family protein